MFWWIFYLQGTATFRAHASKILNTFSYVIDALNKDADMKEIAKIIAEGKILNLEIWRLFFRQSNIKFHIQLAEVT